MMEEMKAHVGDLVYVEDARKWLGGLRSIHGKITAVHSDSDPSIYIAPYLINEGELIEGRKHRMEKLF
jgi:SSS family solute:Na+ symporter